jgi:type II secretory pathway component PulC
MKRYRRIAALILFLSVIVCVMCFRAIIRMRSFSAPLPEPTQNKGVSAADVFSGPLPDAVNRLFANPGAGLETDTPESERVPWESRLYRVVLKGTAGTALAVVQEMDGGPEIIVRPGDTAGSARVVRIERNLLELDGPLGRDILRLPTGDRDAVQRGIPDPAAYRTGSPEGSLHVIDREKLRDLTTRVDALSSEITLQPVRDAEGSPAGFRIAFLNPGGVFEQMGLQPGDTVTAVNGHPILTIEDAYRVLESTPHQNMLTLSVLRDRQNMEIHYVIR